MYHGYLLTGVFTRCILLIYFIIMTGNLNLHTYGRTHGAPYHGHGYVPLRFTGAGEGEGGGDGRRYENGNTTTTTYIRIISI